jgi:hypothetical protein
MEVGDTEVWPEAFCIAGETSATLSATLLCGVCFYVVMPRSVHVSGTNPRALLLIVVSIAVLMFAPLAVHRATHPLRNWPRLPREADYSPNMTPPRGTPRTPSWLLIPKRSPQVVISPTRPIQAG